MISYSLSLKSVAEEDLDGFCVGWAKPLTGSKLRRVLAASYKTVLAYHEGQLVGFVNAISDGLLTAYIPLLEVRPRYQGQGIGTELVRRMLDELKHLYMVDLCCDEALTAYYGRLGMQPARGMIVRQRDSNFMNE